MTEYQTILNFIVYIQNSTFEKIIAVQETRYILWRGF